MLKYQTADGKILTQGNAEEMDVGFADAGLIIVDGKCIPLTTQSG